MVAGSVAAHSVGVVLAGARLWQPAGEAAEAHGRVASSPWLLAFGLVAALVLVFSAWWLLAARRHARQRVAGWLLLLPPLAFTLQELAERLSHAESSPFSPALEPRFVVGLVLQIPFGIVAFLLGRVLVRVAVALVRALAARRRPRTTPGRVVVRPWPGPACRRRVPVLALGHAGRGPPPG